jgi:hypothetical protein
MNRIIRSKPETDFTIISNSVFKTDLSARAMGLLCYMLSLPPDWVIYKTFIYKKLPEGREAITKAWKELEEKKFIISKKTTGTGKGKLPETNYFVYDNPQKDADLSHANNPQPKIPQPKIRTRKNPHPKSRILQSTIEESTIEESIPVIPIGITVPPHDDPKPKKEKKPKTAPEEKQQGVYRRFTDAYDVFFKKLNGVPAQYGKASGAATNSLVAYFRKIAKDRATKDAINEPSETYIDDKAHEGWVYVLNNWGRLDGFLQTKTRLIDINSNIQNIITQLKNGHSKKQTGNSGPTGGNVSTASLAHTIAAVYGGPGQ